MDTETAQKKKQPKKKSVARRIVKGVLWFLGGLLVFVLVAVLTLPLWINPVATSLANALVPKYTGTAFNLERVNLNPYTGKLLISGVKLANPEGYAVPDAFTLGTISAEVEVSSLLSDTIHVREVTVDALSASWVFDAGGTNNIDRIIATVNEKLGPKKEKKEEPSEKKVVVDKVTVKNVRAFVGTSVFDLESLTLTDFGKDTPAKLTISGVRLTNPPGFETENAFSLGSFAIGVETGDLGNLPIKVHDIVIDSPYASYVFDEKDVDNFTRMLEPLLAKGGAAEETPKDAGTEKKDEKKPAASAGSPVTLDRLEVRNLKVQVCKGRFELASLVVTDFGKPTKAQVRLEGAKLVNPDGFKQPNAFSLGSLSVALETSDLSKKPMTLQGITLKSLYAGYVFNDAGASNIDVMFKPLMGGGKKDGEKSEVSVADTEDAKAEESDKGGLPVVIDKVLLEDVRADIGSGQFELKSLNLADFGKDTPMKLEISGVKLTNPPGFETENAFSLGSLAIGMDMRDLGKLPIKIHDIEIDSPYASYVFDEKNVDNFTRMLEPLLPKGGAAEEKPKDTGMAQVEKKPAASAGSPVTVDRLAVRNLKAQVCKGRFELASLEVTDFGKPTNTVVRLAGAKLVNPDGFKQPDAFSLGSLSVALETSDLSKKPMTLHDITLKSLYAGYVFNDAGASNIDVLFKPLMGGGKKDGGKGEAAVADTAEDAKAEESGKGGLPVVIDKVVLEDVRADVGSGQFELKSLNLSDLGKDAPTKLEISGVKLANPPGFEAENAFSLGSLAIGMDLRDLGKTPIKIHDIVIDSPYASYVFDEKNVDNFTRMLEPLLATSGAAEKKAEDAGTEKKDEKKPAASAGSPVTLDRLEVKNLKAQVCKGRFELASLVVTDFGKPTNAVVRLEGAKLANPDGFVATNAFSLGSLSVSLETADLSKKPMVLHDIVVDSPYASYIFDEKNVDNFTRMLEPLLAKDGEAKDKPKEKNEAKKDEQVKVESSGAPVTLDRLEVKNLKSHVCNGRFELASLVVTDFGKPTNAVVRLEGAKLANPEGFSGPDAFSLKSLSIGMETADLSKKPMVFHDIIVDSPYAGVFINGDWDLNFKVLFKPLMGDEKKNEKEQKVAADQKKDEKKKDEDGPRVVIDKLDISGTKIQFDSPIPVLKGSIPIPLPTFTDIGKDSKDGATVEDVGEKVLAEAKALVGPVGGILEKIVRNPSGNMKELLDIDAVKMLGDAKAFLAAGTTNVLGNAKDFVSVGATNVLGSAKDFVSGGATNVLGSAKDFVSGGATNVLGGAKGFIGGFLPGGDKKDDANKKDDRQPEGKEIRERKKEDEEPGVQGKPPEEAKGFLDKINPLNLLK